MTNYLQHRKQCVVIGGVHSETRNVTSGVPQGSILGPLLFVIFINDMFSCVSEGTNIMLYADDTKIWRRIESWNDHLILQHDINMLFEWSNINKMKFHPQKCSVLTVEQNARPDAIWNVFPFQNFFYFLNDNILEYADNEKDLGIIVNRCLNWDEHILKLILKASSRLGLIRRTLFFVKDEKQKRVFYLTLVRSLFEHCSVIWRPTTMQMISKFESIQKRAVKWILCEEGHHYNDFEYLKRLKELDILPMEYKFAYTDLIEFHKIHHKKSVVKIPQYLTPYTDSDRSRLRTRIRHPNHYNCSLSSDGSNLSQIRSNRYDASSLKCTIEAPTPVFKKSFFFRTHLRWNELPSILKNVNETDAFAQKLKHYMWDIILDPH